MIENESVSVKPKVQFFALMLGDVKFRLIDCFISVHRFFAKRNLQTGVQTFHFLSGIKNRVDFFNIHLTKMFL